MTEREIRPLPATHPQYTVVHGSGFSHYRVKKSLPTQSSENVTLMSRSSLMWFFAPWPILVPILCFNGTKEINLLVAALAIFLVHRQCTQVLSESVVVFPPHGIQLETERGIWGIALFTSRFFIPTIELQDFLINEGLTGWNVRYYLVAVQRQSAADIKLHVAFENILPHFPILREVYHEIHRLLFVPSSDGVL